MYQILQLCRYPFAHIIRKKVITRLFLLTGEAFNCPIPNLQKSSGKECLKKYALYTNEQALKVIKSGRDIEEIKTKLYQRAFALGRKIRKHLHIKTMKDVIAISSLIYTVLGIEMEAHHEEVTIRRCFFSSYYDFCVCRFISSLDEGMAEGISDGSRLEFYQTITQGYGVCKAHFHHERIEK